MNKQRFQRAWRAAAWHGLGSFLVALMAATLVFGLWFPFPYRELAGGRELFILITTVDVICGPLLTFVLFNPLKPKRELILDLGLVVIIQMVALIYGLHAMTQARPIGLTFEADRFRIITAADVDPIDLIKAPESLQKISWLGPKLWATHVPKPGDEDYLKSVDLALEGQEVYLNPQYWREYSEKKSEIVEKLKIGTIDKLIEKNPNKKIIIESEIQKIGLSANQLGFLPVLSSRHAIDYVVLLDLENAEIKGFIQANGF